jgi:hypothetical protein
MVKIKAPTQSEPFVFCKNGAFSAYPLYSPIEWLIAGNPGNLWTFSAVRGIILRRLAQAKSNKSSAGVFRDRLDR